MKSIIFTNQKGGVGKTTLTRELGISFSMQGYSVLLIDADPQGNLTKSLCDYQGPGLYEAFEGEPFTPVELRPKLHLRPQTSGWWRWKSATWVTWTPTGSCLPCSRVTACPATSWC